MQKVAATRWGAGRDRYQDCSPLCGARQSTWRAFETCPVAAIATNRPTF